MKTILYGINSITTMLDKELEAKTELLYACTNGDQLFKGSSVHSLSCLATLNYRHIKKIIICSMCVDEIVNSLLEIKFPLEKIYFFNSATCTVELCNNYLIPKIKQEEIFYAIFDQSCNIASFDTMTIATLAEMHRKQGGFKYIHFLIIPRNSISESECSFQSNYTKEDEDWRTTHIVQPILESVNSTIAVSKLSSREEANILLKDIEADQIFPNTFKLKYRGELVSFEKMEYWVNKGHSLEIIEPKQIAVDLISSFIHSNKFEQRKLITFTIREYNIHPERNSDLNAWIEFAKSLDPKEYACVIIRDTYKATEKLPSELNLFIECPLASIDIPTRIALYQRAYINLGATTGPSFLYYFVPNIASIRFLIVSDDNFATSREVLSKPGFIHGEIPCFARSKRHIVVWQKETFELIYQAFNELCHRLES